MPRAYCLGWRKYGRDIVSAASGLKRYCIIVVLATFLLNVNGCLMKQHAVVMAPESLGPAPEIATMRDLGGGWWAVNDAYVRDDLKEISQLLRERDECEARLGER